MKKTYSRCGFAVVLLYAAMSVVSGVATGILGGIGLGVMLGKLGDMSQLLGRDPSETFSRVMNYIMSSELMDFILIGSVIGSLGGMLLGILIMRKMLPEKNNIPIEKKNLSAKEILLMALMSFGLWGVGAFIGNLAEWFGFTVENPLLESGSKMMILFHLYAVFGAPVVEELAFRKTLLDAAHPYGEVPAAFLSALLFGLIHGNAAQFMLAFMLGLLLATVYQRTGRVIYTIAMHFMINLTATIPNFFDMAGINIMTGWYIAVGILVVAGVVILIIFRKQEFLSLSKSGNPDPNAAEFKNPGMRLAVIGGTVLVCGYEALMMYNGIASGSFGVTGVVLRLVPWILSLCMIILTTKLVGKYKTPTESPEPM